MESVILVGGGGHARVVGEAILANASKFRLLGFVDKKPSPATAELLGVPHLGSDDVLDGHANAALVLGVGEVGLPDLRRTLVARLGAGRRWATVVHPHGYVSPSTRLDQGVVVLPRGVVHTDARLGAHVLVNTGAIVEHDVLLGEHVLVGPGAVIGGGAVVGDGVFIGLGAMVRDHVRIGAGAVIGMGAVVVDDVPPGATVVGNPARAHAREMP